MADRPLVEAGVRWLKRMCADVQETGLWTASPRVLDLEMCPVKWMMTELMPEDVDSPSRSSGSLEEQLLFHIGVLASPHIGQTAVFTL